MKLLVVSHACVTPINQSFYADLAYETGWDVSLVVPATWRNEYGAELKVERWKDFEGSLVEAPVWNAGHIPLHLYRQTFIGLLRKERPDAIYVHHEPYGLATAQVYLANLCVDRSPIGFYAAQNIAKRYPVPFRWLESLVLRLSSFCFPVTNGALEVFRGKGYTGVAEVLPLALDLKIYHPDATKARQWRRQLKIDDDVFVVGYLGRLVEEKGLATLLYALQALGDRRWCCVLAGSGPEEARLRALAAELGMADRVLLPGFLPHTEAPGLLSMMNVFVLPSETRPNWKEQFGRVIVEANACGVPVVGTDSGEIPNVIRDTGGGCIVPEANAAALGRTLVRLADDPAEVQRLGERGLISVREKYEQTQLARRFAAVIQHAVEQKGRPGHAPSHSHAQG